VNLSNIVASKLALHTSTHPIVIPPDMSNKHTKRCYNCKEYKDSTDFHKGATMCITCRTKYDYSRSTKTFVNKETIQLLVNEISMLNNKVDFLIERMAEMRVDTEPSDEVPTRKKSSKTKNKSKKKSKYVSSEESSGESESSSDEDIVCKTKSKSRKK
jgi:hypothetical protein